MSAFMSNLSHVQLLVPRGRGMQSYSIPPLSPKNPNFINIAPNRRSSVTARYSRPNRPSSSGRRPRETRKNEFEADPALDISTIRSTSVRLIDAQQNMVGVVSKSEAIQMAEDSSLNLVILSSDSDPPVVKIMDYNKYKYEQQKKKKEQQKKSSATRMDMKELKMGYNIDVHDYSVRLRAAQKFLTDGDKVKVIVQLKGRENDFKNNAIELIKRFQNDIGELGTEESKNLRDRNMFIVLLPNKAVQQRAQETPPKKKENPVTSEVSKENPVTSEVPKENPVTSEVPNENPVTSEVSASSV